MLLLGDPKKFVHRGPNPLSAALVLVSFAVSHEQKRIYLWLLMLAVAQNIQYQ